MSLRTAAHFLLKSVIQDIYLQAINIIVTLNGPVTAVELLEYSYLADADLTRLLLTASLENWSRQTCLGLAVIAENLQFLSHPMSQIILSDLWMGGLRMQKNPGLKIFLGLLFPMTIGQLEFKTKEELDLMPQIEIEEEILDDRCDSDDGSSKGSSSTASSVKDLAALEEANSEVDSICSIEIGGKRKSGNVTKEHLIARETENRFFSMF